MYALSFIQMRFTYTDSLLNFIVANCATVILLYRERDVERYEHHRVRTNDERKLYMFREELCAACVNYIYGTQETKGAIARKYNG